VNGFFALIPTTWAQKRIGMARIFRNEIGEQSQCLRLVEAELADFRGLAWYRRWFDTRESWQGCAVRVEFESGVPYRYGLGKRAAQIDVLRPTSFSAYTFDWRDLNSSAPATKRC
jgi:hypothetical protein